MTFFALPNRVGYAIILLQLFIRRAVRGALAHNKEIAPFAVEYPLDISLTFYRTDMCEEALAACRVKPERPDARTLRKTVKEKVTSYIDLRFR